MSEETRERAGRELDRSRLPPERSRPQSAREADDDARVFVLDEGARFLADPMTDLIIAGIGDVARDNGYSLLIQAARPDPHDVDRLFLPLLEERVDGAFLFLSGTPVVRRRTIRGSTSSASAVSSSSRRQGLRVASVTAENRGIAPAHRVPARAGTPADRVRLDPRRGPWSRNGCGATGGTGRR